MRKDIFSACDGKLPFSEQPAHPYVFKWFLNKNDLNAIPKFFDIIVQKTKARSLLHQGRSLSVVIKESGNG